MIFAGKFGWGRPSFVAYIDSDNQQAWWFLPDGSKNPAPKTMDEFARMAHMVGMTSAVPRTTYAPSVREILENRDAGDADFTPLGKHVIDLSGTDFSGVRFGRADFRGAKLANVKLANARIGECRFDTTALAGVDCSGADLAACRWTGFDLSGTDLSNAHVGESRIENCTCVKTNFAGAHGRIVSLRGTTLSDCDFTKADIPGSSFEETALQGVRFAGANLASARFGGEKPAVFGANVDFTNADVQLADFTGASLMSGEVKSVRPKFGTSVDTRTKLVGTRVHAGFLGKDWSYLDCTGATIHFEPGFDTDDLVASFAILPACNFAGRSLVGAKFASAILHGAHFANCDLEDAKFNKAVLGASSESSSTAADFSGARLGLADFTDADLSGVGFTGTNLKGATFKSSLLLMTDFSNAFVAQVDFTAIRDRRMQGVSFNNACLVSAKFHNVDVTKGPLGRVSSFSSACLLGTDFTAAKLPDATLTNAKLASEPGRIKAVLAPRKGTDEEPFEMWLTYEATQLPPGITGKNTRCPDGAGGPCTKERLITPDVPSEWRQPL